jgi:hypothetical protein
LKRTLTPQNIKNGFRSTSIFPLNENAVDEHFGPNGTFERASCRGSSAVARLQIESPQKPNQAGQANSATVDEFEQESRDILVVVGVELEADMQQLPESTVRHFFVDIESADPAVAQEAAGLDPIVSTPQSITHFLALPTITAKANPRRHCVDPVVDFMKSIMLTSDVYLDTVQQMQEKRNHLAMEKKRNWNEREELKRRKVAQREEDRWQQEARATKQVQQLEAARLKALEHVEASRKKAERALLQAQQQVLNATRTPRRASRQNLVPTVAEMVVGQQADEVPSGSASTTAIHV